MNKKIIEISNLADLSIKHRQLQIRQSNQTHSIPVEDIGILLLSHPKVVITHAVLTTFSENNVTIISCDSKHLPAGLFLPMFGNTRHTKIIKQQAAMKDDLKNEVWADIVRAKIIAQSRLLDKTGVPHSRLKRLALQVTSGDPNNHEAQAAKIYWPQLFGNGFKRHTDTPKNHALNYGYAVLRAAIARSLVCAGLHPALGVFHKNQYDSFALADDLIEPLRPLVDAVVFDWSKEGYTKIDHNLKRNALGLFQQKVQADDVSLSLWDAITFYTNSFKHSICVEHNKLCIPQILNINVANGLL